MDQKTLANLQEIVFQDQALQSTLRDITDEPDFIIAVCSAALAHGLELQPEDIQSAMQAARRTWIERWIA